MLPSSQMNKRFSTEMQSGGDRRKENVMEFFLRGDNKELKVTHFTDLFVVRDGCVVAQVILHEIEGFVTLWGSGVEGAKAEHDEFGNPMIEIKSRKGE